MSQTDAFYRTRIRQLIDDSATSHRVAPDFLENQVNGTNVTFILSNRNLVSASLLVSKDGAAPTATGVTVDDAVMGLFHLATPPAATLSAFYYYQFFSETEIDEFRDAGLPKISVDGSDSVARAAVPAGLFTPACKFAAAEACRALSVRFARTYGSTAQGQSAQKEVISQKYLDLAVELEKSAQRERLDYYGNRNDESTEAQDSVVAVVPSGGFYTPDR